MSNWEPSLHYGITRKRAIELGEDREYPRGSAAVFHFDKLTPREQATVIRYKEKELDYYLAEKKRIYQQMRKSAATSRRLGIGVRAHQAMSPFPFQKKQNARAIAGLTQQIADLKRRAGRPTSNPSKAKIHRGPRGGKYRIRKGRKIYI